MDKTFDLSIIIPALNEAAIIAGTLQQLADYLQQHPKLGTTEVIVVAAGSDNTASIARSLAGKFDRLHVVTPPKAEGKGNDVRLGFQAAKGAIQLFTDADLSTPLHHIAPLVERLRAGDDIVIGRRDLRSIHSGKLRTLLSLATNLLTRTLFLPSIGDSQCGFKGFRAAAAQALFANQVHIKGWAFDIELLSAARRARYRISQLPILDWHEVREDDLRGAGVNQAALHTLRDVLALRLSLWEARLTAHIWPLIMLAAAGNAALAWWIGSRQSVWFDESYSTTLISHSISQIIHLTSVDVHPPLYYIVLKGWAAVFGTTDMALRSLSILCGAGSVAIGLALVKRLWNARVVLLTMPFVVAAPFLVRYAFEIRMYALVSLIGMAATYVLVAATQAQATYRRWLLWISYGLLVTAGMYALYYSVFIWFVHLLWYLYWARTKQPQMPWKALYRQPLIWADAAAVLLFSAWVPFFLKQLGSVQGWFWVGPATYRTVITLWSLIFSSLSEGDLTSWRSLVFMLTAVTAIYFVVVALRVSSRTERPNLVLLILYAVVPTIVLYVLSLPPLQPVFTARYDSQLVVGAYLLFGVSVATVLAHRKALLIRVAALGFLVVLALGVGTLHHLGNQQGNYRGVATYLEQHVTAGQPVITDGPQDYMIYHHYLADKNLFFYAKTPIAFNGGYAPLHDSPKRVSASTYFTGQAVWVVYSGPPTGGYIPAAHVQSAQGVKVGKLHAYLYVPAVTTTHTALLQLTKS